MTLIFIQGQKLCEKSKTSVPVFSQISVYLDEIQYVAMTCWFVEGHANLFCKIDIQGRDLCLYDFLKKKNENNNKKRWPVWGHL